MRLIRPLTVALAVLGLGLVGPLPATAGPPHPNPSPAGGHGHGRPGQALAATGAEDQGAPTYFNSGLAPTPYQGWNTYFGLGGDPTEAEVRSVTDFMVSSGLRDAGYTYVWIDGNWAAPTPRDEAGRLVADPARFPGGMAALAAYIHSKGMKAGIYTDAGPYLPGQCGLGSNGHYQADVALFAGWGFDALKADWLCGRAAGLDPETTFRELADAVRQSPRPMLLNICNPVSSDWGGGPYTPEQLSTWTYTYAPTVADSWRTYTDVGLTDPTPQWAFPWVLRNMDVNAYHPAATGPGHYNDPDYLLPMRPLPGGGYELSLEESKTQLGMWSIMAAPLVIGSDPRGLPSEMISALTNPEIIAVNQDQLVRQGVKVADTGVDAQVWSKVLSGSGRRAVALLNRHDTAQEITVNFADVALGGAVTVRDLWARATVDAAPGTDGVQPFTGSYTVQVPAHGVAMLGLTGADQVAGANLGGTASASPALVRVDDTHATAFVRTAQGALAVNTRSGATWGTGWTSLGGPVGGRILGQPAAYGSAGGRIDVFVRGTDNAVWRRSYVAGSWGPWSSLGGAVTDGPTVAWTSPTQWTLIARGADGKLWSRTASSGWTGIGAPEDRPVYGRPSAVVDDAGVLHVAVRSRTDEVWWRSRTGTTWSAWTSVGGTTSGSPTLLATAGRVYLFALAADNRLWQRNLVDGTWGGWFRRGEFATDAFRGAPGAAAGADGSAWLAVRGVDDRVHQIVL
ncbi:alpha-galactosidase [Micromonospora acroterricola]|uniref:Alpha-galactosidase n=1 Tax=Micromonospora acroterricola TaxID=2202421 RepID=A0A317D8Y5_9ACTN|nr:glycoside hydrolase family 27 protein [Micromonospora acroterricola]PWR09253.1 alpha-galactosidase [Micromonospora acroterricola]